MKHRIHRPGKPTHRRRWNFRGRAIYRALSRRGPGIMGRDESRPYGFPDRWDFHRWGAIYRALFRRDAGIMGRDESRPYGFPDRWDFRRWGAIYRVLSRRRDADFDNSMDMVWHYDEFVQKRV